MSALQRRGQIRSGKACLITSISCCCSKFSSPQSKQGENWNNTVCPVTRVWLWSRLPVAIFIVTQQAKEWTEYRDDQKEGQMKIIFVIGKDHEGQGLPNPVLRECLRRTQGWYCILFNLNYRNLQFAGDEKGLILKTIGNRKGDCAWSCSRWQTQPEKICKSQSTKQCHSLRTLYWFVLCNLLIFSGCVCHLEQLHAQSPFLFPIVLGINLIPFFDVCSVLAVLSPGLFGYVLLYLGHSAVATVAVCGFGTWALVFHCEMPRQISPLPLTPSQAEVCSTMGESIRPSSLHNPTPSAKKHVVQICRSSLSAAMQTVQVSVKPHLSTALKDRSVVP